MGNNCFNTLISKPCDEAVKEATCIHYIELDTTTGKYTGEEYIQYNKPKAIAGKETDRELVQHIKPDEFQSNQINTYIHELTGKETDRELVQHIKPDKLQSNQINTSTHELKLRGQTVNNTCE